MKACVVIPTYNERDTIDILLDAVLTADPRVEVIIVDDGSPDGTGPRVAERSAADPRIHLVQRDRRSGYASAVRSGMRQALEMGADRVLQMDADLSHDPAVLPDLLAATDSADVAVGSRYVSGGGTRNWGILRRWLSAGANSFTRTLLALPVRDCTGGYRCYRRHVLEELPVLESSAEGYVFQIVTIEMICRAGMMVTEVPIFFADRQFGKSKLSRAIIAEAFATVLGMAVRRRLAIPPHSSESSMKSHHHT